MIKNDRIVVYALTYTWPLQTESRDVIFDWACNYYFWSSNNLASTELWLNTDSQEVQVVIAGINNSIKIDNNCELYDANGDLYWEYKIVRVKKNKSVSGKVDNTYLVLDKFDGSEGW